jgi:hypothetical protein
VEAYDKFQAEFAHLEMLLASTLFAYNEAILLSTQRAKEGYIDRKKPVFRKLAGGNEFKLANNLKALHKRYRTSFKTILRETIFVRAISVLEVFLIDTVREILLARKALFLNSKIVTISYPHLLSFKNSSEILSYIINKECRNLQNGGFIDITKYFRDRLKIEFNNFKEPLRLIFEYHDKRHLIVHRLGLTDKEYRHKYATEAKKVNISEKYLISAFKIIRAFCDFVLNESLQIINSADSFLSQPDDSFARIAVKALDKKGIEAIKKNYIFSFDDNVIQLKDLNLQAIKETDDIYNLIISGDINFLKRYIAILKRLEFNKSIEIINIELTEVKQTKQKNIPISIEMFEKIRNHVPPQPWEKGMHKMIASNLGVSNKTVQAVIKKLISDGLFKHQVNGQIIE